jgi:glucose dehydrogenase
VKTTLYLLVGLAIVIPSAAVQGQQGAHAGAWPTYGGDAGSTKYSALDQIRADNVQRVRTAWTSNVDS